MFQHDNLTEVAVQMPDCFNKLSCNEFDYLCDKRITINYNRKENLTKQGAFSSSVSYIIEGYAKLCLEGHGGRNIIVSILKPSDFADVSSLFDIRHYYSVIAVTNMKVALIEKEYVKKIMDSNTRLTEEMMKCLVRNEKENYKKMISLSTKNMYGRFADALIYLYKEHLIDKLDNLNRQELADLAGVSLESAIRILSEFKKEGVIDLHGKRIIIKQVKYLMKLSMY